MMEQHIGEEWLAALSGAAMGGSLVKVTLSKPMPQAGDLKSIDIRPILVKRALKLSFTYHHQTHDIVKNYPPDEAIGMLRALLGDPFTTARLCTTTMDLLLDQHGLTTLPASQTSAPTLSHDRAKQRLIDSANKPYLHALGITDAQGKVYKTTQDKFRQINKYIEILDGLVKQLPPRDTLRLVDMGAGKGYLTFALYDYLTNTLNLRVEITGVEYRADLVEKCNDIARAAQFTGLRFVQGTIAEYDCTGVDGVIALHACDTATDDAIAKAIHAGAALIVVAPCCHKQIRRALPPIGVDHPLHALLRYGTYADRMAEMVTDAMRAQWMELRGYRTNLFEFIDGEHTPKNVMIVATKLPTPLAENERARLHAALEATKAQFGIAQHQLERLLGA